MGKKGLWERDTPLGKTNPKGQKTPVPLETEGGGGEGNAGRVPVEWGVVNSRENGDKGSTQGENLIPPH